jgi:hypothetical protein
MQTVDYVLPSGNLLRSFPGFPYLDLVPGMPKLRHIGQITSSAFARFQSLRKSGFEVATFSEIWLPRGAVVDDQPDLSGTGRSGEVAALVISLRLDINPEPVRHSLGDVESLLTNHPSTRA